MMRLLQDLKRGKQQSQRRSALLLAPADGVDVEQGGVEEEKRVR